MRRSIVVFCLLIIGTNVAFAQFSAALPFVADGLTIGLEKNNSAFLEYKWKQGFYVGAKHTVIADKLKYQSFQFDGGFVWQPQFVSVAAGLFATTDWKGSFWNVGGHLSVSNLYLSEYFRLGAEYIPYYDSDLKFKHGWAAGAEVNFCKQIAAMVEFSDRPDYRVSYKRLYVGLVLNVLGLHVKPMFEMPFYDSGLHASHGKVVVNVAYTFSFDKARRKLKTNSAGDGKN